MHSKVSDIDTAMSHVMNKSSLMISEFVGAGEPLNCINWLHEKSITGLTLITNTAGFPGGFGKTKLFKNGQIRKLIGSHVGTTSESTEQYLNNQLIKEEFYPMGTWAEIIRAGGVGLGGVLVPVGINILDQTGLFEHLDEPKKKIELDGKQYLLEKAITADVSIIKGYRADPLGNIEFRLTGTQNQKDLAMAGGFTIAEVNEIVNIGETPADRIGCPGVFVDAIVQGHSLKEQHEHYKQHWIKMGRLAVD